MPHQSPQHTSSESSAGRRGRHPRRWRLQHADSLDALRRMDEASVDSVITDPPYGIGFQGMAWDGTAIRQAAKQDRQLRQRLGTPGRTAGGSAYGSPSSYAGSYDLTPAGMHAFETFTTRWTAECLRVLKPGGHIAIFGYPRTFHRLTSGVEAAGLEIRDVLMWLHGQGFPKSKNLRGDATGWGTTLKPAYEPILLARRPLDGGTAENHNRHGVGALHIDACRQQPEPDKASTDRARPRHVASSRGRWPANVLLSHAPGCAERRCDPGCPTRMLGERHRFFYTPKASRAEREAGCEQLARATIQTFQIGATNEQRCAEQPVANIHPTVKPLGIMRWLIRLTTPPGGLVLDPFTGSGSTGAAALIEGMRFHGIEREGAYLPIARARIRHWGGPAGGRRGGCR